MSYVRHIEYQEENLQMHISGDDREQCPVVLSHPAHKRGSRIFQGLTKRIICTLDLMGLENTIIREREVGRGGILQTDTDKCIKSTRERGRERERERGGVRGYLTDRH